MNPAKPPDEGFAARWSRRKAAAREGVALPEPVAPPAALEAAAPPAAPPLAPPEAAPAEPPPTLADVALLGPQSDFRRFVAPGVDSGVKNAALKTLFSDPHFNVMDGLDTYIADYSQPDPLPEGMLRKMAQSQFLGLFADEPNPEPTPDAADENADLRLQPDDAAGCRRAEPGTEPDPGRQR